MQNTKKLLSINGLKKYFPVAKESFFKRERLFVRANEEISLDIFEGETLGLVGESGCGKSTLGRVILQLYEQTAGSTVYYGRSVSELAPRYVEDVLKNAERYVKKYRDLTVAAKKKAEECEALGDGATFFQLQEKNLAQANADSAFFAVASILGGFAALDGLELRAGATLLFDRYRLNVEIAKLKRKEKSLEKEGKTQTERRRLEEKKRALEGSMSLLTKSSETICGKIEALKKKYADNAEFCRLEAFLDDGIDLSRLTYNEMRFLRKDLQIIFQDPYSSLDPRMTVGQIIEEGLVTHGFFKRGSKKMREYILEVMKECGLQEYMLHRYPHQFSGGQRQRICIARALAVRPKFVVCDECVSALDVSIQSQIINLLQELQAREKFTYLFISHDLSVVRHISGRIGVMYLGNIVELADAKTVFKDPRHPYTVALLSSIPTTDPEGAGREKIILEGNIPSPIRPPSGCKFHTRCFMAQEKCRRVPPELKEVAKGHFAACHFPERKLGKNGEYLFERKKTE
ncbi:MAG: ATP-binding cassette domain-containing protein [Clostridia bacterium]|nr:ATP-binding cassette domain-containing protein [Clostridia bacterium]